MKIKVSLRTIF